MFSRGSTGDFLPGGLFEIWTWMVSLGVLAIIRQLIPREYTDWIRRSIRRKLQLMTPYIFCDFREYENSVDNKLYRDVHVYLSSLALEGAQRVYMCKSIAARAATFSLANNEAIDDTFQGAKLNWVHKVSDRPRPQYMNMFESRSEESKMFTLRIKRKDKERLLDAYIEQIEAKAKILRRETRELRLYTNGKSSDYMSRNKRWESVIFSHPANFDTLALDGDLKSRIISDLDNFAASKDYYQRVGKSWKRGYLLYGPPGTGKSSMIAAIANKMRYDIYDLELTAVESNSQLRKLLLQTDNKSIIVIEDIDCSLDLSGQRTARPKKVEPPPPGTSSSKPKDESSKVTLSGLLNFVDGLWSCCGSERIFIFTTNFVKKLDPALLRAGRMDMHIHLSYCTFSAFKMLARNYLDLEDHEMFKKVELAFEGTYMTPAAVSEVLIQNLEEESSVVLQRLIECLGEHREDPALKAAEEALKEAELEEERAIEKKQRNEAKAREGKEKKTKDKKTNEKKENEEENEEEGEQKNEEESGNEKEKERQLRAAEKKGNQANSKEKGDTKADTKGEIAGSNADLDRPVEDGDGVAVVEGSDDSKSTDARGEIKPPKIPKPVSRKSGKIVPLDESEIEQEQSSSSTMPVEKPNLTVAFSATDETQQVSATIAATTSAKC